MKYLFIVAFLFIGLSSCSQSSKNQEKTFPATIKITGKVNNPQQGQITLLVLGDNELVVVDTIELKNDNTFAADVVVTEPNFYRLSFFDRQMVNLVLSYEDVSVHVDGSDPFGLADVKGSTDTDLMIAIEDISKKFQEDVNELNDAFIVANAEGNTAEMERLREVYSGLDRQKAESIKQAIRKTRTSIAAVFGISSFSPDDHFPFMDSLATNLMANYPSSRIVREFSEFIDGMRVLAVGAPAPDINLPNPNGEFVSLSSLRGQYVLIDFWAGWCKPCRDENPNVVRIYNKYNPKGFTVFGVSLDRTREEWVDAIAADGLTWPQVSDLKYFNSDAALTYQIQAIPATVLVDPDGIIIAKNLRGRTLEDKLVELFGE